MILSQRIQSLTASPIRKLSPYADAAKAAGKKVYHLNIGQPDIATPAQFMGTGNRLQQFQGRNVPLKGCTEILCRKRHGLCY